VESAAGEPRQKRVLVVEDTSDIRELLTQILGDEGYDVVGVANGAEALDALNGGRFQLVLLDLMMPVMNGFELLGRLAENAEGHPPIVAMSAFERFRGEARELGAESFLSKPVDIDRLLKEVERVLAVQQAVAGAARVAALARVVEDTEIARATVPVTQRLADWLSIDRVSYRTAAPGDGRSQMLILGDASAAEDVPGGLYVRLGVAGPHAGVLELADGKARDLMGEELAVAQFVADWLAGRADASPHGSAINLEHDRWGERLTELLAGASFERGRRLNLETAIAAFRFAPADEASERRLLWRIHDGLGPGIHAGWRRPGQLIAVARPTPDAATQFVQHVDALLRSWTKDPREAGSIGLCTGRAGAAPLVSEILPAVFAAAEHVRASRGWGLEQVGVSPTGSTSAETTH